MNLKNLLRLILLALLPVLYGLLTGRYPDFPLHSPQLFVDLVLWIIGLVIGGWQALKLMAHYVQHGKLF